MNSKTSARTSRSAFTLIELLVVIAIVSLLVSILLPALEQAKELTRVTVCQSNVRGISLAMIYYMEDNGGRGPQYYDQFSTPRWWSQALMKDGHLEGYGMLDCPTAADEGISHRSGDNLGPGIRCERVPLRMPDR